MFPIKQSKQQIKTEQLLAESKEREQAAITQQFHYEQEANDLAMRLSNSQCSNPNLSQPEKSKEDDPTEEMDEGETQEEEVTPNTKDITPENDDNSKKQYNN